MKTLRVLLALIAPVAIAAIPVSSHAASISFVGAIPNGSLDQSNPTGVDPVSGGTYAFANFGGLISFNETAGSQPDPTNQVLFNSAILTNASSFTLTVTGPANDGILPLDRGFGNGFSTFTADGKILSDWTASVNAAGNAITFTADAPSDDLVGGERFSVFTTFSQFNSLPTDFTYTVTWSGDAAVAAVPEVSTWAMMLAGFAGLGLFAYRRGNKLPLNAV